MAKKIQDGNQIVTNVDSNDNLTFSIKSSFIDSTPTVNSTNLVTSGGVKSALDINTTDIAAAIVRIANNETNISNHTSAIQTLNGSVSTNTTDINTLKTTTGNLSTNVNANTTNIGTLNNLTTTSKTSVVNAVNELNAPEKWVSVGVEAPTDGRRVWFDKSVNLIPNKWSSGSISGSTGEPVSYGSRIYTTNKIKVEPNTQYTISNYNTSSYNIINLVDGYTSNGTYIGRIGSVVNGTTITTQANCEYINVTLNETGDTLAYSTYQTYLSNGTLKPQLQKGAILTTYEPYVEKSIKVDNEDFISMSDLVSVGANQPSDGKRVWFKKGKNLLPTNKYITTRTTNGITFTNNGDGTFNLSGTATANTTMKIIPIGEIELEANQPYYLYSSVPYNGNTFNLTIAMTDNSTTKYIFANNTYTPTTTPTNVRLQFYINSGKSVNATNVKLMLVKGNTAPSEYESYIEDGIYVDNELFYNKSLIKSINFGSITTSASGYYDLGLMCNEVAIIGIKHGAIASGAKIEIYSNQLGHLFVRCSVNGEYSARTIDNLIVYCI